MDIPTGKESRYYHKGIGDLNHRVNEAKRCIIEYGRGVRHVKYSCLIFPGEQELA